MSTMGSETPKRRPRRSFTEEFKQYGRWHLRGRQERANRDLENRRDRGFPRAHTHHSWLRRRTKTKKPTPTNLSTDSDQVQFVSQAFGATTRGTRGRRRPRGHGGRQPAGRGVHRAARASAHPSGDRSDPARARWRRVKIALKGDLAGMLSAARDSKRSPDTGDLMVQTMLVARARNRLNLEFCWAAA